VQEKRVWARGAILRGAYISTLLRYVIFFPKYLKNLVK
jgi:hypothetical protein